MRSDIPRGLIVEALAWGHVNSGELAEMLNLGEGTVRMVYSRAGCPKADRHFGNPSYTGHRWYMERLGGLR